MSAQPPRSTWRESLAWAAGLFEGEGCFIIRKGRDRGVWAQLKMTDEDAVRTFRSVVRVGGMNGPYFKNRRKPIWVWRASAFEDTQAVIAMLWPWLHARRRARAITILIEFHARQGRQRASSRKRAA